MWYVIGVYRLPEEDDYEEILEQCYSFHHARELGIEYAPWFGDEWVIMLRHTNALTGHECGVEGKITRH